MRDKVVYIYKDENGKIFYIGQGTMMRAYQTSISRSEEFYAKLAEVESATGLPCYPEIVSKFLSSEQAMEIEKCLIDLVGLSDLVNKPLGRPTSQGDVEFIQE